MLTQRHEGTKNLSYSLWLRVSQFISSAAYFARHLDNNPADGLGDDFEIAPAFVRRGARGVARAGVGMALRPGARRPNAALSALGVRPKLSTNRVQ